MGALGDVRVADEVAVADAAPRSRTPRAAELAWIGLLPCALLVAGIVYLFGPPLGRLLLPADAVRFWPAIEVELGPGPERTEYARFLLALTGPLLLTAFIAVGARRARPLQPAAIARLTAASKWLALAFVVTCVVVQRTYDFGAWVPKSRHVVYFTIPTLVVAAAIAALLAAALARDRVLLRMHAPAVERRRRRTAALALAAVAAVLWLLPAVNFEDTIIRAHGAVVEHIPYWLDETYAPMNGRFPLVSYATQYASLWPYLLAAVMVLVGPSLGVYTIAVATISAVVMVSVFVTLRRIVRSSVVALILFLPLLATSFYMMEGPADNRYAISNLFGTFPLRYAGPLLLFWLLARHLDGAAPRRPRWLFLAGGLVVLNNTEFGLPALGATIAALLWSTPAPVREVLRRLALELAIGLAGALALVSALTLATAGSLPHLELLVRFTRLFALGGWGEMPMLPVIGMSTVIYLTYVAAIGVATVRAVNGEPDRLMTGLLAWTGIFGLGIGSYYMGRSHPEVLTNMFAAWALCVTLLLVLAVRAIAARASRRPTLAEAACLFAFGVFVCSLAQVPKPWSEWARLHRTGDALYRQPLGEPFIARHTRPGEAVAILTLLGHRTAYDVGVTNVTPYAGGAGAMPTIAQLYETLAALRAAGGHKVFYTADGEWQEVPQLLLHYGYRRVAVEQYEMAEYSDAR